MRGEITFLKPYCSRTPNASIQIALSRDHIDRRCHDNLRRAFPTLWFSSELQPHLVQHSRRARKMDSDPLNKVTYKRQRATGETDQLVVHRTSP